MKADKPSRHHHVLEILEFVTAASRQHTVHLPVPVRNGGRATTGDRLP